MSHYGKANSTMRTCSNESGGILLELIAFAFILVLFTAGAARAHSALGLRFRAILRDRNERIEKTRNGPASKETLHVSDGG